MWYSAIRAGIDRASKFACALAVVAGGSLGMAGKAEAFGGSISDWPAAYPIGLGCYFTYDFFNPNDAAIYFWDGNTDYSATNTVFSSRSLFTYPRTIDASRLQSLCGITDVTIVSQRAPDSASFAAATYIGIKWRGTLNGTRYEWEVALSGQTNTQLVNTRTAVTPVLGLTAAPDVIRTTVGRPFGYTLTPSATVTATSGTLTVTTTLPNFAGLSSSSGTGWSCGVSGQDVTCTSTTSIAAGTNGNTLTLNVVGAGASSGFQPVFTLSGGGAAAAVTATPASVLMNGLPQLGYSGGNATTPNALVMGTPVTLFAPLTASSGTSPYTWSISPALPAGLSLVTRTGRITGTPSAVSPQTTYTVTLTDDAGASVTSTFLLAVNPPVPTVSSVSPSSGGTAGGTTVTLRGTNFVGTPTVTFGSAAGTNVTVVDSTTLTVTSPAGSSGLALVQVTTAGGTSAGSPSIDFNYIAPPTITGIDRDAAREAGGTTVNVFGSGFSQSGLIVRVGGTVVSGPIVQDDGRITITTPAGSGKVSISVSTDFGTSADTPADDFTYVPPPVITGLSPNRSIANVVHIVTISGRNLTDATLVMFGSDPAAITSVSATEIEVTAIGSAEGVVDVSVTTPYGTSANTAADDFTFGEPPTLTSFAHNVPVPYNSGSDTPVTIDAATRGAVTGSPTSWTIDPSSSKGATLSVNALGQVSYTAPRGVRGSDSFRLYAENDFGKSDWAVVTVTIGDPVFSATAPGANGVFNSAVTPFSVVLSGGKEPYTVDSAMGLPPGLSISSTGQVTGTPSVAGTQTVQVTVTDASNPPFTGTATLTLDVARGNQTITFTDPADVAAFTPNLAQSTFALSGSATSGLGVAFTSATPLVCTVSGATVRYIAVGVCTVNADQAGNPLWNAAPRVQQSFSIGKGVQRLGISPIETRNFSPNATLTVSGFSEAVLPVTLGSATPLVCTVGATTDNEATLTVISVGLCTVTVDQPGDENWNAGQQVISNFGITLGVQTISFTDPADIAAFVPDAAVALSGSATSGLTVAFSSTTPSVCTVSGGTATIRSAGICTVNADQAGDSNWNAAARVQQSFSIGKGVQTVSFTDPLDVAEFVPDATVGLSGSATSGLAVAFTTSTPSVCNVNGSTATIRAAGVCTVNADQAGDSNWNAAARVQQSFNIGKGVQGLGIDKSNLQPRNFSPNETLTLTGFSDAGLPVTFGSSTPSVCTVSGTTLTVISAGICTVTVDQPGNDDWKPATQVQHSFSIGLGFQAISFTDPADIAAFVPDATVALSGSATSGLAVVFASATPSVCTVSGATATIRAAGVCTVNADQAGDSNWNAAARVQQSFSIGKGAQAVSIGVQTVNAAAVIPEVAPYTPNATVQLSGTATSGLPVTLGSATPAVCTVSGTTATVLAAGVCIVTADQPGNDDWNPAPQARRSFAVPLGVQTVRFTDPLDVAEFVPDATVTMTGSASSGLTVAFTSATPSVCTVNGAVATLRAAGVCTVNADQAGDSNWNAAARVQQSFSIGKGVQTVSFTGPADVAEFVPDATVSLVGTATSGLAVAFASDAPAVCTVSGTTATIRAAGVCTVNADQAGDGNWSAAARVQQSFSIGKGVQTISFSKPANTNGFTPDETVTLTATGGASGKPVVFATTSAACTVSGNTAVVKAVGTCTVTADQAGDDNWAAAAQVTQSFEIGKAAQTITFADPGPQLIGASVTVTATASSGLPVTFTSLTRGACSVTPLGGEVSLIAVGDCTIAADQAGDATWSAAPRVVRSLTVTGENPEVQKVLVRDLQQARAKALVMAQPDLSVLLTDPDGAPTGGLTVSSMGGDGDLFRWDGPVWFRIAGSRTVQDTGERDHYAQLSFGSHVKLGPNALLGLMGTIDTMRMTQAAGLGEGSGWLVGPYLVTRLGQSPIYLDMRALTGRTMDEITETGRPASQVDGNRSLVMVKLSGSHKVGGLTLTPSLGYAMVSQSSDAYRTASGILIPGVSSDLTQGSLGLDFGYKTVNAMGPVSYSGGLGLVFAQDGVNGASEAVSYRLGVAQNLGEGLDLNLAISGQTAAGGASRTLSVAATLQAKF